MYNIVNVIIHLIGIALILFACVPSAELYRKDDPSLEKLAAFAGFILMGCWALLTGVVYNFKSLIALFW